MTIVMSLDRRQFLQSCAALSGFLMAEAQGQRVSNVSEPQLSATILGLMEREAVPGLQIALIRDGQIAAFESFGVSNAETRSPVTPDTVFEAASLSKPVFAYLVMKLAEEGVIDLEAPLQDILKPPAAGPPELLKALTATLVLSHTTGFPNWYGSSTPLTLGRSQGRQFSYSGMAYVYLQRVVERLLEKPLQELVQQRIFAPRSMASASMVWRGDYEERLAFGHRKDLKPVRTPMHEASAASSLVCTAQDYARFVTVLLMPPPANATFLKSESLERMFKPRIVAAPDVHWGLGWGLQLSTDAPLSFFHWGSNVDLYNCFVVDCPATGEAAVVMTNSGNGLRVCRDLIPMVVRGDHPALRWRRVFGT